MSEATKNLLAFPLDSDEPIEAEIIFYQFEDANIPVEVRYLNETFWLIQKEIAELFDTTSSNISMHLKNIFEEGELSQEDGLIKFWISEFNKKLTNFYNLDASVAVGYHINSLCTTRFCQWTKAMLKKCIQKRFVLNDEMLKNGVPFGDDYFNKLLVRIGGIHASEPRVWRRITDIFQECSFDYDRNSKTALQIK